MHPFLRGAFTLVELLVVIAIIGVLVALLLPAVQAAREAARRSQCTNNMKQTALGLLNYESAKGEMPGGANYDDRSSLVGRTNWERWVISVLPYMEQAAVFSQIDQKSHFNVDLSGATVTPGATRNNKLAATTIIASLICPSDTLAAAPILENRRSDSGDNPAVCQGLWYKGSMGPTIPDECMLATAMSAKDGALVCMGSNFGTDLPNPDVNRMAPCYKPSALVKCRDSSICVGMICRTRHGVKLKQVTDGTSATLLLGETLPAHSRYNCIFCENFNVGSTHIPLNFMEDENGAPASTYQRAGGFKSLHPGGVQFAYSDGSVHFIPEDADYFVVNALGTKAADDSAAAL